MTQRLRSKAGAFVLSCAVLFGGILPGTCMIRTKQAVVEGSKSFLAGVLLDPSNLADFPFDEFAEGVTGG